MNKIGVLDYHTYLLEIKGDNESLVQAASIISSTFNVTPKSNNPAEILNNTIQVVKKSKNKTQIDALKKMLSTIDSLKIDYNKNLLESIDFDYSDLHKDQKLLKEKPTKDVLKDHQDLRKIGVDYEARDVGGKRAMIKDILSHNHGANKLNTYKSLKAKIRQSMDEVTSYGDSRSSEHDFATRGASIKAQYHLINRKTNQIVFLFIRNVS